MEQHKIRMTLVPLNEEEVKKFKSLDLVALYVDKKSGVINVGRPSIAPYYPALANMFGFNSALDKGYYLVLKEETELADKPIYSVEISSVKTVIDVTQVNVLDDEIKVNDVLANYLKNNENKIRK